MTPRSAKAKAAASPGSAATAAACRLLRPTTWLLVLGAALLVLGWHTEGCSLRLRAPSLEVFSQAAQPLHGAASAAAYKPDPPPPLPRCKPDLRPESSPFVEQCTLLRRVCFDQGSVVLYDSRHVPAVNGPPVDLPVLKPSARQTPYHFKYWPNATVAYPFAPFPALHARPAASNEARRYLARPAFSTCTVPILFYPHYDFNFVHSMRDNAALFYSALRETPWAEHARPLLITGEGTALSPLSQALWQPVSRMRVDAWAEASRRLGEHELGRPPVDGGRPPSHEGGEQRCFDAFLVCLKDIKPRRWQLHAYGRHVAAWYAREQPQQLAAARATMLANVAPDLPPPPPESALRGLGARARGRKAGPRQEVQLRIVFQRRTQDRLLVNAAELLRRCNAWRYTAPSGARVTALCWETDLPDVVAGVAAAQEADIFVGAHGANTANAWLMRPGSSLIELTMHGFDEACTPRECAHANIMIRNMKDDDTQLAAWKVLLCDPRGSWTPGAREARARQEGGGASAAGAAPDPRWPKSRNLIVRWEALETALRAAVDTGGDMAAYRRRWEAGTWWWLSTATQVVPGGPQLRTTTCSSARAAGRID